MHPFVPVRRVCGLLALLLASSACRREVVCADRNAGTTSLSLRACSDGRSRVLSCALDPPPGAPPTGSSTWRCTCAEDAVITRTFSVDDPRGVLDASSRAGVAQINQRCGWRLRPP